MCVEFDGGWWVWGVTDPGPLPTPFPDSLIPLPYPQITTQVNGQKVTGDERGLGETVSLISQSPGPVEIKLRRGQQELVKRVTPKVNPDTGRSSIGVQMAAHIEVCGGKRVLYILDPPPDGADGRWTDPAHPSIHATKPTPTGSTNPNPTTQQRVDTLKARSPQEALQFTAQELTGMLKEATGSLKRFAAPGGMDGLTGPLGIVQVRCLVFRGLVSGG